jgi:flagellar hook protein FlgE
MQQFQEEMDVIGNNIANVNTTGFKSASTDFAEAFDQQLSGGVGGQPIQIGTGVTTDAISTSFVQGSISPTGSSTDVAISGGGFFVVKDTVTGAESVTRDGSFHLDSNGYLLTSGGLRVQGYTNPSPSTTMGDIKIDNTGAPNSSTADLQSFNIGSDGTVSVTLTDGTNYSRGQLLLQNFSNPGALIKEGANLYSFNSTAGPLAAPAAGGSAGVGEMVSGALELSNVDLAGQFADLITAQRAFQANARVITTSDEVLQELVNLKH